MRVVIKMNETGHRFSAGSRIRLALSTSYWPIVWPSPVTPNITIVSGVSQLALPQRAQRNEDENVTFGLAETDMDGHRKAITPAHSRHTHIRDMATGVEQIVLERDDGHGLLTEVGVETEFTKKLIYSVHPGDPTTARAEAHYDVAHRHNQGWDTRIVTRSALACTATDFVIEADIEAFDGGRRIFSRSWTEHVPRDLA